MDFPRKPRQKERTGDDVMKRGIIFDMDGTLWDSAENVAKSWNVAIRQYGVGGERTDNAGHSRGNGKNDGRNRRYPLCGIPRRKTETAPKGMLSVENDYLREHGGILYDRCRRRSRR